MRATIYKFLVHATLRRKVLIAVSCLMVCTSIVGAIVILGYFNKEIRLIIAQEQYSMVSHIAIEADEKLHFAHDHLASFARQVSSDLLQEPPGTLQRKWEETLVGRAFLLNFYDDGLLLISRQGQVLAEVSIRNRAATKEFKPSGMLSANAYDAHDAPIPAADYLVPAGLLTDKPAFGEPVRSLRPPHGPVELFTVPILDANGAVAGYIGGSVRLEDADILGPVLANKIGSGGYMYLYSKDRLVILHPDPKRVLVKDVPVGVNVLFDKAIKGFEGTGETVNSRGRSFLASFKHMPYMGWIVASNYPKEEAYAPIMRARKYFLGIMLAGLVFSFLVIGFLMRRYLDPISDLAMQIRSMKGDAADKVAVTAHCVEATEIADAFNGLMSRLSLEQEGLRQSEERLRAITSSAMDAIVMCDSSGRVSFWNKRATEIFGHAASDAIGADFIDLLVPERYRATFRRVFDRTIARGKLLPLRRPLELAGLRRDGQEFVAELSGAPLELQGSLHIVAIIRDITERKLAQEELLRAKEAAEAATQAKGQFLANMSHESTPLNAVLGMAELALAEDDQVRRRQYLEIVIEAGKGLTNIIGDILDFSKIEEGKLELGQEDFVAGDLVRGSAALFWQVASTQGLALTVDISPGADVVLKGDPVRLRQVITNFLSNALKFTHKGSVTVQADVRPDDGTGLCEFTVRVKDTGVGIPEGKLAKVFERFSQADNSTTRRYGGTGLGLTISSHLVQLMGGRLEASSTPGQGSVFMFSVPLPLGDACPAQAQNGQGAAGSTVPSLSVLVVEDNKTNQTLARRLLEKRGHTARVADNGALALELVEEVRFDLILMDLQMPELDGMETTRRIRCSACCSDVPIIALTANAMAEDRLMCIAAGMQGYLSKPISTTALFETIETLYAQGAIVKNDS